MHSPIEMVIGEKNLNIFANKEHARIKAPVKPARLYVMHRLLQLLSFA